MSAPSLALDRKKLLRMSAAALALRIAAILALVGAVPALRAFARQYTVPDRVIVFLIILGTLYCADTLLRWSRHAHALAVSALALALNLINSALSLLTLGLPLLHSLSTSRTGGTVACAPLATLVCAHPMITALFLAGGGTLYVCAVLTSSLFFLSHLLWMRAHVRGTAAAGVAL